MSPLDWLPDDAVLLVLCFCGSALDTKALANSVPSACRAAAKQWLAAAAAAATAAATATATATLAQAAPTPVLFSKLCLEAGIRELETLASWRRRRGGGGGGGGAPGGRAFVALSSSVFGSASSPVHCATFGRDGELFCGFGDGSVAPANTTSRRRKGVRRAKRTAIGIGREVARRCSGAVQLPGGIQHLAVGESWVMCASGRHLHRVFQSKHAAAGAGGSEGSVESTTIAAMIEAACDSPTLRTTTTPRRRIRPPITRRPRPLQGREAANSCAALRWPP